jgi:hypothetical protein
MTDQQPAELSQPSSRPLHDPAAFVSPELAPILISPVLVVLSIRHDQLDAAAAQSLTQRIGVVAAIGNHAFRFLRGRPFGGGTRTWASVVSASVTSLGEALSSRTPSGRPSPSTSTIHFVPLPRLVFPTADPLFSPGRSCRREKPRPTSTVPLGPAPPVTGARPSAIRPRLPIA